MPASKNKSAEAKTETVTPELVAPELRAGTWRVYPAYQEHRFEGERRRDDAYITHKRVNLATCEYPAPKVRVYRPLVDEPGLFFRFASLWDGAVLRTAWRDWIRSYGVLGLRGGVNAAKGGPAETFSRFAEEARLANETLRLYEAAAAPVRPDLDYIREYARRGLTEPHASDGSPATNARELRQWALFVVGRRVQAKLQTECFPQLYLNADGTSVLSYGFHTLLGALYMQMAALHADGASAARWCKAPNCYRLLAPGRRRHAKFCDKACLMRWRRANGKP